MSRSKVKAKCVCDKSIYCDALRVLCNSRSSRFSLLHHQLRASAARRAAWLGQSQRQRWSPARVGVVNAVGLTSIFDRVQLFPVVVFVSVPCCRLSSPPVTDRS